MKDAKVTTIDLNKITIDMSRNIRENNIQHYDLKPLVEDLAYRGQLTEVELEKVVETRDGKPVEVLYPLRGFRRLKAMEILQTTNDPSTGQPYLDQSTGKPWKDQKVKVKIFENLSQAERIIRMFDHGQTRNLSILELNYAIWESYDAGLSDRDIIKVARGLMEQHYPPRRTVEDTDEARLNYWKGALQMIRWAWESPYVLREVVKNKLRGQSNWPIKSELKELRDLFISEQKDDRTNTISRAKPGPKFMKRFEEVKRQKETEAGQEAGDGETRPKPTSMRNRGQVEELHKLTDSQVLKTCIDFILNKVPQDRYSILDKFMVEKEKGFTEEDRNVLAAVIGIEPEAAKTEEPAQAQEEQAQEEQVQEEPIAAGPKGNGKRK